MTRLSKALLTLLPLALACAAGRAGVVDAQLEEHLAARAAPEEVAVIVQLADRENLSTMRGANRAQRLKRLLTALRAKASITQGPVETHARGLGARDLRQLWAINALALKVPAARVQALANHPAVHTIRLDSLMQAPVTTAAASAAAEWNLAAVKAPDLWALGLSGHGVVIANMDTGVDVQHPDLAQNYRGGANSWFDPHGQHPTPYDAVGHGTQTMGILVGGSVGGTAIGMAPDASWIAVKQYNDAGQTTFSQIHLGFQWLLDPDGDPDTDDAPHVVNASWGFAGTAGQCITEFDDDIALLKAAGIGVVFAGGNDGPAPASSVSPANNPQGFATGAVDETLAVAMSSSRGPSACDGSIFPALVAPGVNIVTSDLSFGGIPLYMYVAGTSFAAPHAAGAMALLAGAFPDASVAELEAALRDSAQDLGANGEDNSYGHGLVSALAAYQMLGGGSNAPPQITSTPVTSATQGSLYSYDVEASDADGDALTYSLTQAPVGMTINPASGLIAWTPTAAQVGNWAVAVRVTDAQGLQANQSFTVSVASINQAPSASADSYQLMQGGSLSVAAPGVLGNDSDADGDALTAQLVNAPASGVLSLSANGSFSYTPATGYAGTTSFTYRARDPAGALSGVATVTLTVVPLQADLAVTQNSDGRTTVERGTTGVTYTIVVTNLGPNAVTNAALTDTLPGGTRFTVTSWACTATSGSCTATGSGDTTRGGSVTLPSGASATYTLVGSVPIGAPLGSSTNSVTMAAPSGLTDPNSSNNSVSDTDTIVSPQADLAVTRHSDERASVARGTTGVTYTITVTNNGPSAVMGATLTDTLPGSTRFTVNSWTCTAPGGSCTATGSGSTTRTGSLNLPVGATATYTLMGSIPAAAPLGDSTHSVTVAWADDPSSANNTLADTDTIVTAPVAFTGESGIATLNSSGTTLRFGNQSGNVSDTVTLTVGGTGPVTFGLATVTNGGTSTSFSKGATDTCSGNTLSVGQTCQIQVNFNAPTNWSSRTGAVNVPYTGPAGSPSPAILSLTGN